jgi:hypothetical protein
MRVEPRPADGRRRQGGRWFGRGRRLLARDRSGPPSLVDQLLICPVLDDRALIPVSAEQPDPDATGTRVGLTDLLYRPEMTYKCSVT